MFASGLAAFEMYWRTFGFDPNAYYTWPPRFHMVFKADPQSMPGVAGPADFTINSYGLRGDPPSRGRRLILAIGGSTTEDAFLKLEHSWTYRLQKQLSGAWVGNMGKAGTNSRHHALAVEKILPRLPTVATLLVLVGLNDMLFDLGLHHPPDLGPDWDLAQAFAYRPVNNAGPVERLATYQLLRNLWRNRRISPEAVRVDGNFFNRYKARRAQVLPADFVDELPDLSRALAKYQENLRRIITSAGDAEVVFVTQPSLWTPNPTSDELRFMYMGGFGSPDTWGKNPRNKWMTPRALLRALTAYNRETLRFCSAQQLSCIDLASELPKDMKLQHQDETMLRHLVRSS